MYSRTLLARIVAAAVVTAVIAPASLRADANPPSATVKPERLEAHGDVRTDDYFWLRERDNPDVIAYLEEENAYTDAMMAPTEALQKKIFDEIRERIPQTDASAPYRVDDYYYYYREEDGKAYKIYCRKKGSLDAPEEIVLDVNAIAEGQDFMAVWAVRPSPDHRLLAFAVDNVGRRKFKVYFKSLDTGELLADVLTDVTYNLRWANDNKTILYTQQDLETLRWFQVRRHKLGTDESMDEIVYEETDTEFSCWVFRSRSDKYLMIASEQTLSSEIWYVSADDPASKPALFLAREENHEYDLDHIGDRFYIKSNRDAKNFRIMWTPDAATDTENWRIAVPHRDDVFIETFELFDEHFVVKERKRGLIELRISNLDGANEHYLQFAEPTYVAYLGDNYVRDTSTFRFEYTSMTTPYSTYDYDMNTKERSLVKRDEVRGGFDPDNYTSDRLFAKAEDGTRVPISILYRNDMERDGQSPLLLYGYGSYGSSVNARFRPSVFSLIDRGFVYAIAHIRGGQELGRQWYEDGKLLKKKNTFTDFIACGEHLVRESYTSPDRLYAMGGSAGGLLIGAVVNMRPDLFDGAIAHVPWVDVVTTMLDDKIPLTTSEYDEWGDPREKEYYDYMLSYSPYDNVEAQDYPHLLVTTGLHDSQVQYWEPAKWVAKLRAMKTGSDRLLLKTYMDAGHSGGSGRYREYEETAFDYAFLIDLVGKVKEQPAP